MKILKLDDVDQTDPRALALAARLAWAYATYVQRRDVSDERRQLLYRACAYAHEAGRVSDEAVCPIWLNGVRVLRAIWGIGQLGIAEWESEVEALTTIA